MIGGAKPGLALSLVSFIESEMPTMGMVGGAIAAIVAAGVFLAARFVRHSISRVTGRALTIEPTAPQGSIPLGEVPVELRVLVQPLNGAFDEIATFIERQRRFLGNAAHELRTPLAILRAKLEDVTDSRLRAALVLDTHRLTALVSAMLDLSRLKNTDLKKSPVDLVAVTRDADYTPLALDQNMDVSLLADQDGSILVFGSEAAIRSAISNLVGNALVHAYGAKTIVAKLDNRGGVSICDDGTLYSQGGTGAAASVGAATLKASSTGLGLSIVREIMLAHDGTLSVNSTRDGGTIAALFFAEFPK
jgi:signal transduction histidine kinase